MKWFKKKKPTVSPFDREVNERILLGHVQMLNNEVAKLYNENQELRKNMAELEDRYCILKAGLLGKKDA